MKKLRSSIVEPVLGTLLDCGAMRKVRIRGMKLANKHVLLEAMAYNLKKLMKHQHYNAVVAVAKVSESLQNHVSSLFFRKRLFSNLNIFLLSTIAYNF